jgi:hypothetical protein
MASSDQNKERTQRNKRVGPGVDANTARAASRVSRAAGSLGSQSANTHVEQRANIPPAKRRASAKQPQGGSSTSKKGASSYRPAPSPASSGSADPGFLSKVRARWQAMQPHHQQRVYGLLWLGFSLLLIASLTVLRSVQIPGWFAGLFITLFGWGAYLLALGLLVFSIAYLVEGIRNQQFIRWSLVIGLVVLWLLVLFEGQLILGRTSTSSGVLASLVVRLLSGWPAPVGHILFIGLIIIVAIVAFRLTLNHVVTAGRFIGRLGSAAQKRAAASSSPFLGQRPKYSRYGSGLPTPSSPGRPGEQAGQSRSLLDEDDEDDEDGGIDFEPDFEGEDDPLNDINLHKHQVGQVPREARFAQPLNPAEHKAAVQGARQPPLPIEDAAQPAQPPANKKPKDSSEMEPLAPNPLRKRLSGAFARAVGTFSNSAGSAWRLPDINLLNNPEEVKLQLMGDDTTSLAKIIQETLRSFRVEADVRPEDISIGPTVIRFGIRPTGKTVMREDEKGRPTPVRDAAGNIVYESRTRVSRIMALQNDLALVLEAKSIRMEAPVPGRPYVGVEIPNKNSRLVTLREVLESKEYQVAKAKSKLTIALGKDVAGAVRVGDLARMPHLLIAGATGSGKSICLNSIIASILTQATPDDVRLLMVDPKMVELIMYNGVPHLLAPVVTEVDKVVGLLKRAMAEMERRYRLFSQLGVRNLDSYRKRRAERIAKGDTSMENLPSIVIIIDELADLMMAAPEEVEGLICRLAQLARATGIHLVIATQRPSVDVITGLIKANIPTRISFMVSSAIDSRTIIDMGGAERLLGRGDMLYLPADAGKPERIQGAFVAEDEAERLIAYWRQQAIAHAAANDNSNNKSKTSSVPLAVEPGWEVSEHVSDDVELEDDLLEQAEQVVREYERASISLLQRRLRIGYSRAARLIDLLEARGIIGPSEMGGRSREVIDNESRPGRRGNSDGGGGRTMADEAADIVAEERARQEFLRKQAQGNGGQPPAPSQGQGNGSSRGREKDEGKR